MVGAASSRESLNCTHGDRGWKPLPLLRRIKKPLTIGSSRLESRSQDNNDLDK
jgi:hypothetical protein